VPLMGSRDEVFAQCDYLTMHTKLTDETKEMINKQNIAKMKDGVRIVNSSRGGVINDADLAEALKSGKVAAAAIDVYVKEPPPPDHPLFDAPNTVLAPHLGASTKEAQLAVTLDAVDGLMNYLLHDEIRQAVNVTGLPAQLSDRDKAYMDLASRMGAIMSCLGTGGIETVSVTTHGESLESLVSPLQRQILVDLLNPHFTTRLNLINVDAFANERGIKVEHTADLAVSAVTDSVTLKIKTHEGIHEVTGEIFLDGRPRIMSIDGYQMNLEPEGVMVMILNDDQPGVLGLVGTICGNHKINIADCMLSRKKKTALMAVKLDSELPPAVMDELLSHQPPINKVLTITLPPIKT
ncbi:MAG: NAD(P)-dependent oxidoreductase, partial [Planctomycetota bacterium]